MCNKRIDPSGPQSPPVQTGARTLLRELNEILCNTSSLVPGSSEDLSRMDVSLLIHLVYYKLFPRPIGCNEEVRTSQEAVCLVTK